MEVFPPIPENEAARLERLKYYDILDTEAEEMFDDLTKLAAQILEVPMCALSLIDEHRQWFKSRVGLQPAETAREISFCQYTIMEEERLEVEDATKDERFKNNPFVSTNDGIRFYSGIPLRDEEGHALGSLCVLDFIPRTLSEDQQKTLKLISNTVMKLIRLRREKQEVEKLTLVKDEFISNMSHEIRTPLNAIIGFNDLLSKTPLNEEQSNFLKTIKLATHNLKNIINDVLDVSKLEGNKIELEEKPISLVDLVQHCIKLQSPNAKAKNLKLLSSLDHELPSYVLGDETRLVQILNNLISNALKFTEKGSVEVKAMVEYMKADSTTVLFEVRDTGIGIPSDKKQKIFERFEQAETSTTRLYGGTGLGLNIVQKLVSLHGAEVQLESEEGKGSSFSFKLSFEKCTNYRPELQSDKVKTNSDLFKNRNVLLVEDNFHNQLLAKTYFKRWGAEITIAENGAIALETLLKSDFDIILMDLQMPVMNGFTATEKIRTELKLDIPIIGCSANSESSEKMKCFASGMNDYITKPYSEEDLIQTTAKHLQVDAEVLDTHTHTTTDFDNCAIIIADLRSSLGDETVFQAQEHFLARTPMDIEEIKLAAEGRDMAVLESTAHLIAGTLGALKFYKGCECAKKLETTAKIKEISKSVALAKALVGHLSHVMECFEQSFAG